jgi:hypothetical protein
MREKMKEEERALTEQWYYSEIMSIQRTVVKMISGY